MTERYYCHKCRKRFKTGREYALHVEEKHKNDRDVGVYVRDAIDTEDIMGGK